MGRLAAVENDRREPSHEEQVTPQVEPGFRDEPAYPAEEDRAMPPHDSASEYPEDSEPSNPPPDHHPDEDRAEDRGEERGDLGAPSHTQGPGRSRPRGRGRGRRGPSQRDRRPQDRNRRREGRPHFQTSGHSGEPRNHEEHRERESRERESRERESRPPSHLPPETRSLLEQVQGEVDQIREVLESVLRDLDHVAEQLTKAEHEKDVAEAEIEQLRESLRRLHR